MIACASFSRISLVWKAANPIRYSQVCFFNYNMGKTMDGSTSINQNNKRKTVQSVWKPVSTGLASYEEYSAKELDSHETVRCSERPAGRCQVHESHGNLPESIDCRTMSESEMAIKEEQVESETLAKLSVPLEVVKSPQLDYSHFISLPLAIYPELVEKLHNFQNNILGVPSSDFDGNSDGDSSQEGTKEHVAVKMDTKAISSDLGIDKSIFIKPKTFHLTVLMLKLWNKDLVATASEILQKISSKVNDALDSRPVSVKLQGLGCMRGSPAKARVLYAPVNEVGGGGRLLRACQVIIEAYVEAGLVLEKDARHALKLHATLMNARHRRWKKGTKKHDTFDARLILERYGSEEWGDYVIREAHLSRRFSFDERGYYHCCASIPFPESMETKHSLGWEERN